MTLQTTFQGQDGTAVLTDAMAVGRDDRGHHLGARSPGVLLRSLTCTAGDAGRIAARLRDTNTGWRSWSALHQAYQGPWRDLVHHSGRVLQALTFAPTGAIVAAPTTSLPEAIGGERNWDYRYTWVRDASLTMEALWVAACPDEAAKFFAFLADAAASQLRRGKDLQIMFGVGGEHDLSERTLPHPAGWRASQPVRVGNGAWTQRQLDVYGELLLAAQRLADQLGELDPVTQQFLAAAADTAAGRWQEKDQGIWEIRGEPRDFLYSKLMCWVALDRAIALAPKLGAADRTQAWTAARDEIRAAIDSRGWNDKAGAFTQAFGRVDPGSGEMIGNFPQAFSHIGLVNAAWAISQAQLRVAGPGQPPAPGSGAGRRGGNSPMKALHSAWVPGRD
jgi:GH15 family glucan-1,4-alpha-glucosidase